MFFKDLVKNIYWKGIDKILNYICINRIIDEDGVSD